MSVSLPVKILLVDDNEDFSRVTEEILMSAGYTVALAREPMAALDAIMRFQPDICLLDISLPGMDGYDLARRMRGWLPTLSIIAISGYSREPQREIESGAVLQAFLEKPFNYDALAAVLTEIQQSRSGTAAPQ